MTWISFTVVHLYGTLGSVVLWGDAVSRSYHPVGTWALHLLHKSSGFCKGTSIPQALICFASFTALVSLWRLFWIQSESPSQYCSFQVFLKRRNIKAVSFCGVEFDLSQRDHISVLCEDVKDVKLLLWLRLNWQKLAARFLLPLVSLLLLCLSRLIKFSISFTLSWSSFKKKSTRTVFSLLIWSLISLGMSGIIQSTSTLRNITRF